ncbi:MAG: hypothetical protein WDZ59_10285 [Pirellulales bacterium]
MKPVLQALLLADHVYTDSETGKRIVAGIFHRIQYTKPVPPERSEVGKVRVQVPITGHTAGSPFCYFCLTEVYGRQPFQLRLVNLKDESVLLRTEFTINCSDPLAVAEGVLGMPPFKIPEEPGTLALELLWNEEPIGSYRIIVEEKSQG